MGLLRRFLARHWGKVALAVIILAAVLVMRLRPIAVDRHVAAPGATFCWRIR